MRLPIMSTKGYINKYNLTENTKFSQPELVKDLIQEVFTRIQYTNIELDYKIFEHIISDMKMKLEMINNKSALNFNEDDKLWNYFYAYYVSKLREFIYPNYQKGFNFKNNSLKPEKNIVEIAAFTSNFITGEETVKVVQLDTK